MLSILVASSKGGCGKSTLSTGLAAYFAIAGKRSVLVDTDPQHSALHWCERRAATAHPVLGIDGCKRGWEKQLPRDTQRLVIDTPAGSRPRDLAPLFAQVHAVLVPVQPGPIDLEASRDFLQRLREADLPQRGRPALGLVGNRLRPWTSLSQHALEDIAQWPFPLVASLRDNQAYALLAGLGKSLFDYHAQSVREQQADWDPLFAWLREVNRRRKQ